MPRFIGWCEKMIVTGFKQPFDFCPHLRCKTSLNSWADKSPNDILIDSPARFYEKSAGSKIPFIRQFSALLGPLTAEAVIKEPPSALCGSPVRAVVWRPLIPSAQFPIAQRQSFWWPGTAEAEYSATVLKWNGMLLLSPLRLTTNDWHF